jgi:hypothetical protein
MSPRVVRLLLVTSLSTLALAGAHFGWQSYSHPQPDPVPFPDPAARIDQAFARLDRLEPDMDERRVEGMFPARSRKVSRPGWPLTLGELPDGAAWGRLGDRDVWWRVYAVPGPRRWVAVAFTTALSDHRWPQGIAVAKRSGDGPVTSLLAAR